jgi:ribonuclease HI
MKTYTVYCDGATYKSNPSPSTGVGIVCYSDQPRQEVFRISQNTGSGTNNYAEYMALVIALEACIKNGFENVIFCLDSQLVVNQCNKVWRVKEPNLQPLYSRVSNLREKFKSTLIKWVPRTQNQVADKLSKDAL